MDNKKEVKTTESSQKYIKNNFFLFCLLFLPIMAIAIFIGIFSIENFRNKVSPFFALIILAVVLYVFQLIIHRYAKDRNIIGGRIYYEWMRTSSANWIIPVIFIVVIIIIAVIKYGFRVIF